MQVVEEGVDQIAVDGEEEEETKVSIFLCFYLISINPRLIFCLLSGLALQAGSRITEKSRIKMLVQQKYSVSEKNALQCLNFAK